MDQDSDYCSNDSDGNVQGSSRTPTPPITKLLPCLNNKQQILINNQNCVNVFKSSKGDNFITFLLGKDEAKMKILKTHAWKSAKLKNQVLQSSSSEIKVKEWSSEVFKVFLNYLENEVFKTTEKITDYVAELMRLCLAYEVPKLLAQVTPQIQQYLTLDNCVEIYHLAAAQDFEEARVAAYNYFLRLGNAFLSHASFLKLDCITLSILISSDDFPIVELTLFNRLKDWVTAQCKRLNYPADRKEFFGRVAGLLFQHVRYAQMTPKEFRTDVIPSGLLNKKEMEAIQLRHRTYQGVWYMLPPCPFVDRPRLTKLQFAVPLYNNVQIGFRKIAGASSVIQESVRFMVSHDIFLTSIGFFGPAKSDRCGYPLTSYSVKILVEGDYSKYHCRCPSQNASIITRDNFSIDLQQPIRIQRLEPYKLTVWIDGDVTQFGVFPLPQAIVLIQDRGELITFHFGDADADPIPVLETNGAPSSSTQTTVIQPTNFNHNHHHRNQQFKQEPRMSGVIRFPSLGFIDRHIMPGIHDTQS